MPHNLRRCLWLLAGACLCGLGVAWLGPATRTDPGGAFAGGRGGGRR